MDLDFVSVHKHAKIELGQYQAVLTSHLVNNPYILKCSLRVRTIGWSDRHQTLRDVLHDWLGKLYTKNSNNEPSPKTMELRVSKIQ